MQYDRKLWQMAGKLNYAVAHLRSLIGGASTQWSAAYVWRAVNLLRRTTKWAGLLDFNLDFLTLRSLVRLDCGGKWLATCGLWLLQSEHGSASGGTHVTGILAPTTLWQVGWQ